jgi:hypothetical protein
MALLDDVELQHAPEQGDRSSPGLGTAVATVVVLAALGVGGYFGWRYYQRATSVPPPPAPMAAATPAPPPIVLPALEQSDDFIRQMLSALSSHPQIAAWLAQGGLARRAAAVVDNLADGNAPTHVLRFLAPAEAFSATRRGGRLIIDPKSYARYDSFADGIASLDSAGSARALQTLLPLLDTAYRELGHPGGGFEAALDQAIAGILSTPTPAGDVGLLTVERAQTVYEFADRDLEKLPPAQKLLLRIGPRNAGLIQAKLREIAAAAGRKVGQPLQETDIPVTAGEGPAPTAAAMPRR